MIGPGPPINEFGAIPTLDISADKVTKGIAFSLRKRFSIAKNTFIDITFDPTAFVGKDVVVFPLTFSALNGPIFIDIYSGATADDNGTILPAFNRSLALGSPAASIIRLSPSNVDVTGLLAIEYLIPSSGVGVNLTAGGAGDPLVAVTDVTKKLLFRLTNTDTVNSADVGVIFDFFEVP